MKKLPSTPVLLATRLVKSYGGKTALNSVSLTLHRGQFVALLGPNGAGKSTLIQILSGLFVPDQGDLFVLGHDIRKSAPKALAELGVVFQQSSLDLDLSIRANLLFHTDLHGIPRTIAHAGQAVRALSGGNRRKVELVRALLHKPRFLLMDEATVGLDPGSRHDLIQSVQALTRAGDVAVLWATHLVDEVENADRVVVLNRGEIAFDGAPGALLAQFAGMTLENAFLTLCKAAGHAQST
jgi:ABC-2 type transport system ATP-binding protein